MALKSFRKSRNIQFFAEPLLPDYERKSRNITILTHGMPRIQSPIMRERQGHQSRCHGLSTFLAELVVFDIGKVEISQYYLTHLRTEKSKSHTYNSRHAGPSQPGCERKNRNITHITHGMPRLQSPFGNRKVEIPHI